LYFSFPLARVRQVPEWKTVTPDYPFFPPPLIFSRPSIFLVFPGHRRMATKMFAPSTFAVVLLLVLTDAISHSFSFTPSASHGFPPSPEFNLPSSVLTPFYFEFRHRICFFTSPRPGVPGFLALFRNQFPQHILLLRLCPAGFLSSEPLRPSRVHSLVFFLFFPPSHG